MKHGDPDVSMMRESYNQRRRFLLHAYEEMGLTCFEPVSYTHLDVYKRQAIYRTRMMIEDGGELLVIAPGIKGFGENPEVDGLIRRYGYKGTPYTMERCV